MKQRLKKKLINQVIETHITKVHYKYRSLLYDSKYYAIGYTIDNNNCIMTSISMR